MVIIIMGVSGSGKSTIGRMFARELGWIFIDADDYHSEQSIAKMKRGIALSDEDRFPWLVRLAKLIGQLNHDQRMAILACSALKKKYRDLLRYQGPDITYVYLKADFRLINERFFNRSDHYMPVTLLQSQFADLEEPKEAIVIDAANDPEQIVGQIRDILLTIPLSFLD
jgi:gluconokinase